MHPWTKAGGAVLMFGALLAPASTQAQEIEVTPANQAASGWTFYESNATGSSGISGIEPRDGDGSVELVTTNGSGRTRFGYGEVYNPAAPTLANLSEVSALAFDWFRSSASTTQHWHAPVFRLHLFDGAQRSELVWEAVYNGYPTAGPGVPVDSWMTTDLTTALFYRWMPVVGVTTVGGSQVNQALSAWANPGSGFYSADARITGITIGAGSGWANEFTGYADNVTLGVNGDPATVWNFNVTQASTVPEPLSMVLMGTGLAGLGAIRRRRRTGITEA